MKKRSIFCVCIIALVAFSTWAPNVSVASSDCMTEADCDDGDACNGIETCDNGTCRPGDPIDCDDGDPCTIDSCDPAIGCVNTPVDCPDGGQCDQADGICKYIVKIDIKPCSYPNSINLKAKGLVPVAVLTDDNFDALDVDPVTVYFANALPVKWTTEDVGYDCGENDGDVDLLLFYKTQELNLSPDSTVAELDGHTFYGVPIEGVDMIKIVPKKK